MKCMKVLLLFFLASVMYTVLGDIISDTSKISISEQYGSIDTTKGANKPNIPQPPISPD